MPIKSKFPQLGTYLVLWKHQISAKIATWYFQLSLGTFKCQLKASSTNVVLPWCFGKIKLVLKLLLGTLKCPLKASFTNLVLNWYLGKIKLALKLLLGTISSHLVL